LELKNYMEDLVINYADKAISEDPDFCKCKRCRLDVLAMALNDLKPKYVVAPKGFVYARLDELEAQYEADAIVGVTKAMKVVRQKPRHPLGRPEE